MCETSLDCTCQSAAINAYRQLRADGVPDRRAFETAAAIVRFHHPDSTLGDARFTVSGWLTDDAEAAH